MWCTAVVILNWNGREFLEKFLPPLLAHTPENQADIYVADNGSTDNSVVFLEQHFPSVKIIQFAENHGFAGGYNKALAQIAADAYVLLNSDVKVSENWLVPLIQYLENHTDTAAVQPKILSFAEKSKFEYAGAAGGFIDKYGYPFCRGRIFGTVETDNFQYDNELDIFWASGACLVIRAADFWNVGGFDEEFFAHQEEIDLCWRLRSGGRRIVCLPQSVVYHVGGGTLTVENPRKTYLNFRNNLLLLYKNLPENRFRKVFFVRFFLDYLAAFQLLASGKVKNFVAVVQARYDFWKKKKRFLEKRKKNLKNAINSEIAEILPKSIIFQYYFNKIKSFSQIK